MTREVILDAAEKIASDEGFAALTMRAVAAEADAAAMALYRHFDSKEELVEALLDRMLGRFELGPPSDDWLKDLRGFANAHRQLLERHPWALHALFSHPSPGLNATRIGELALAILDRAGFSNERSVAVFSGLIALNYGWVSFAAARASDPVGAASVAAALAAIPPDLFPHTAAVGTEMAAYGSEAHYDFVLECTLTGLRASA